MHRVLLRLLAKSAPTNQTHQQHRMHTKTPKEIETRKANLVFGIG
jgi:hypothetical protein